MPIQLETIWPFYHLSKEGLSLCERTQQIEIFHDGESIIDLDMLNERIYVVLEGEVDTLAPSSESTHLSFSERLVKGDSFGLSSAFLQLPSHWKHCAIGEVRCAFWLAEDLRPLLDSELGFRTNLASVLRESNLLFQSIDSFCKILERANELDNIPLSYFVQHYKTTRPALHPKLNGQAIDFGAWSYAINRLPPIITETHHFLLTRKIPQIFTQICSTDHRIRTKYRRRSSWSIGPGKALVVLRDSQTDLADFITNMCVHFVEARKIRHRFRDSKQLEYLTSIVTRKVTYDATDFLNFIPLLETEWNSFQHLWGQQNPVFACKKLMEIILHHEDYLFDIERISHSQQQSITEKWSRQIATAITKHLASDTPIHIISSNTYGVRRCLSPWVKQEQQRILNWGEQNLPEIFRAPFANADDRIYAMLDDYLRYFPDAKLEKIECESSCGITRIKADPLTGIQVDVINLSALGVDEGAIVNIDYAFGKQGEDLLGALITAFGPRIESINVMGKAGALTGERGDILLATQVLMERSDAIQTLCPLGIEATELAKDAQRNVHAGPVLTVYGTLLQNRSLLSFYRHFWHCVGLEMGGSFYARQIHRGQQLGLLSTNLPTRFAYYVSDLPLAGGEQLSKDMNRWEYIPPLYAITRAFLKTIISG